MKQLLVILLKRDKEIDKVRKKYVHDYKKVKPHITLVYPFEIEDKDKLYKHIKRAIKNVKPFKLTLFKLRKSTKDYYLYLLLDEGKDSVMQLYKNLNKGVLKGFKNKDIPRFIPHLSLGKFKSKKEIDKVIQELKKKKLSFKTKVDSIQLLTIDTKNSVKSIKNFKL